jgi:anthraniloyl-CoA monooxygenase
MKVVAVGGGPGGLYAALLLKKADPSADIAVYERNAPDDTFGFGLVFSAATLAQLEDADAPSYDALMRACARWDPVDIAFAGARIRARGNRFAAISRKRLLAILQQRCRQVGITLEFRHEITDPAEILDADLVLGADGINSRTRARFASTFGPRLDVEGSKYIWLGTTLPLTAFTFFFAENDHGRFQAHAYPYDERMSTFIVECDHQTWRTAGLDRAGSLAPGESDLAGVEYCQRLFAEHLAGHRLVVNNSRWLDWTTVRNRRWHRDHVVLLGDAAHTAHFSIGSGTKLALEDAIALVDAMQRCNRLDDALDGYEASRRPVVERLQDAAAESMDWFARYPRRYAHFAPPQFAYSLLTRSTRVTHDNLRSRDPVLVDTYERWFAQRDGRLRVAPPPALTPLSLRATTLPNRTVLTAPNAFTATAGMPLDADVAAVAGLSRSGAGLVLVSMVAVSERARATSACRGLYASAHQAAWEGVITQAPGTATFGVQLVHAGRRGATRPRTAGTDRPLRQGAWPLVSASPLPYTPASQTPAALDRDGMDATTAAFTTATRMAAGAGFGLVEVHAGSGYLLGSFISPLTNHRADRYGGDIGQRMAFPLEVVAAVRDAWPDDRPLSVCLTASDLAPGGISEDDAVAAACMLAEAGVDVINVGAGHTTPGFRAVYDHRAFLAGWSDLIRNRARVPTMTSGNIPAPWAANDVIAAGKADLCVLDPPAGQNPAWVRAGAGEPAGGDPRWSSQEVS